MWKKSSQGGLHRRINLGSRFMLLLAGRCEGDQVPEKQVWISGWFRKTLRRARTSSTTQRVCSLLLFVVVCCRCQASTDNSAYD